MRALFPTLFAAALGACAAPPSDAYVSGQAGRGDAVAATPIGKNATGEACTQQPSRSGPTGGSVSVDIFCGTWTQPSARVQQSGAASAASLPALATAGPWRAAIDTRFACAGPTPTTILGGEPALLMQCTRLSGGWPHVALVASVGGQAYLADGVLPALRVVEQSIGVLSGRARPDTATAASGADALMASRMAAAAFSSGDIGLYEGLMTQGTTANLGEDFAASEKAFRAALALQEKALGRDNPNTVAPLMHLALQLSDQGRFTEADTLFARADKLAPQAADPGAVPRLAHYRALNDINQRKYTDALGLLDRAEAGYAALLPKEVLEARPTAATANPLSARTGGLNLSDLTTTQDLLTDPAAQSALMGVVEARRNRAIALRSLGRVAESSAAVASARDLARANGMNATIVSARLFRTTGAAIASADDSATASDEFAQSSAAFARALPGTRPVAETNLLRAGELFRRGRDATALDLCRGAVALLRELRTGTSPALLQPCLAAYAAGAARLRGAERQTLLAEMFEAAQLAQGGVTSQQIAQATARLGENARDPKVAEAIRRRQDASNALAELTRQRDDTAPDPTGAPAGPSRPTADLDKRIAAAQETVADADAALQAASPNFGQLVQQVSPAADVLGALQPGEAFASITLSDTGGWIFLLRDGQITVAPVDATLTAMGDLVRKVRAGIEPTGSGLPTFDVAAAHAVYADTLGRVEPALADATGLVVVPNGPLLALPFEVLLTGDASPTDLANAPWLVRRFAISHVPAAANFVALRKIAGGSRAANPWFGFGDLRPITLAQAERSFGPACADSAKLLAGLPPLPYAKRELEAARILLGAQPSDQLLGAAFTAAAVRKASLADYRILHFATHALLPTDLKCQSEPAIVTSDPPGSVDASGALLTASQVQDLKLDADTVILSACNTGGPGGSNAGESLSGLARTFFFAGARSLLVTHWAVNDQAAAFLVADTLRRLREAGQTGGIGEALRAAQLGVLADAGKGLPAEIAHPFFWAPFALIGVSPQTGARQAAAIPARGPG